MLDVQGQKMFQIDSRRKITKKTVERKLAIPEEDVKLVADQTGKSLEEAKKLWKNAKAI